MSRKNVIPLFAAICLLLAAVPFGGNPQEHDTQVRSTMEMGDKEFFSTQFKHLVPHALTGTFDEHGHADEATRKDFLTFFNLNLWQIFAIALVLLVFGTVLASFRTGRASFLTRVFRGWVLWLRDDLIYNTMGPEDGRKFAPYFMYLFFFIAFMNLFGLLPLIGVTATASLFVTGSLAFVTFLMMLGFGIKRQGLFSYFRNLLPPGLPIMLLPLMAAVELVGLFIKPFALTVRLFANMLAGHMIIYSFVGMIFLFAKMLEMYVPTATASAVPAVLMAVFISIVESFIALLQAYVFVFLSVIFVHQSMHPAH